MLGQISATESSRKTAGSKSVHKPPVSFSFSICVEVSCLTVQVTAQCYLCSRTLRLCNQTDISPNMLKASQD